MKKIIILLLFILTINNIISQVKIENASKILKIDKLVSQVFEKTQFEGVKMIKHRRQSYIVCSVIIGYGNSSEMGLVTQLTAERNILAFLNNDQISAELIIETDGTLEETKIMDQTTAKTLKYSIKTIHKINRNVSGFIKGVQCLSVKDDAVNKRKIYFYFIRI